MPHRNHNDPGLLRDSGSFAIHNHIESSVAGLDCYYCRFAVASIRVAGFARRAPR